MRFCRSPTYIDLKHKIAEKVRKTAQKTDLPTRALLSCISTNDCQLDFTPAAGRQLETENINSLKPISSENFTGEDLARCILSNKNVTSILLHNIPTQKLVVDYSSPNIAKPFHVGHLRSTILGNYLANLKQYLGDEVVRINYLGDWGTQFGILSAAFQQIGSEDRLRKDPLNHLVDVYVKGNKMSQADEAFKQRALDEFAKLEADEKTIKDFWWKIRDISLKEYFKIYAKLGIKFDLIQGESAHHKDTLDLVESMTREKLLVEKDGLRGLITEAGKFVPLVKSNGSTLYLTRDICAAISRKKKFNADSLLYVTDISQAEHFQNLDDCLKVLRRGDFDIVHVKFSKIPGLSTREGQVVLLQEVLDEAARRALESMKIAQTTKVAGEEMEKTAFDLGLSALFVKTMDSRRLGRTAPFNWETCFSWKGNSGIALQYAHARICTLLETNKGVEPKFHEDQLCKLLEDPNIREAILHLARFDECLLRSDTSLESCELVLYLFQLRHVINRTFKSARVKDEILQLAEMRLLVLVRLQEALAEGLRLLGLRPVKKM
ncbi:probable arginine--tRNA ligase, mitochondrial [Galendromus occidentalis]|uniref:Probable arginine--tRNA ligase, mitochondrial n=1 Tax=Galendromus occidentalis TaxID=34638 RepID=A0AAJ6VY03_9ACAR|nr:probable arginine--tRNA ligase, mitochondrial [Galendromus occidentalis]